jgi:hypothetical protein
VAEALKTFFSPSLVRRLAADLARAHPRFPVNPFVKDACAGLDALELLDRGRHIARALGTHLPASYPDAIDELLRSLGPEHATDELLGAGMAPFFYLPHTMFVAERGLDHFELSMRAQHELTRRFSAESSIRPYIAKDPDLLNRTAAAWLDGGASPERRALIEHALRGAVKRGDAAALRLVGFGKKASVSLERVIFQPRRVTIGGRVTMTFTLRNTARAPRDLLVDVAVHFVKARGVTGAKVFKLKRLTLGPREHADLQTSFSLAIHTTRVPQPGVHEVDVIVNGRRIPAGSFRVLAAK